MKKLLTAIAVAVFLIYPCVVSASYVIHLKDGREFATERYWEEGEQIKFKRYGGVIGIQKDLVRGIEEIEDVEEVEDSVGETRKKNSNSLLVEDKPALSQEEVSKIKSPDAEIPPEKEVKAEAPERKLPMKRTDLELYRRTYLDLKSQYEQAKKIYWKARRAKDIETKEKALEEVQSLDRQLKDLENQVKEKNNGALPEWWK